MTFTQLRILQAVARTGNMTRAAEELASTQSAVSHALRALESELGVALLVRGNHGVSLTAAGRAVCRRATLILTQVEAQEQEVAAAWEHDRGSLRVGALSSANARLLPPILRRFGDAHPQVRLTVMEGSDNEVLEWLETGAADIATLSSGVAGTTGSSAARTTGVSLPAGLVARPLAADRMLAGELQGTHDPSGVVFTVLAALWGMEREYIRGRTLEGHESARRNGKTIGGAAVTDPAMLSMAVHLRDQDHSLREIAAQLVITKGKKKGQHPSPATVMRLLREHDEQAATAAASSE
jgi:DNA-binding MarR family transcriptional regulator